MPNWGRLKFGKAAREAQNSSRGKGGRGSGSSSRGGGCTRGGGRGGARTRQQFECAQPTGGQRGSAHLESALEDKDKPFLNPRVRSIVPVPLEFSSARQYCAVIAHNLLAEFWHVYREGGRGPEVRGTAVSDSELLVEGGEAVEEGMMQHLLSIGGSLHIVTQQAILSQDSVKLSVRPSMRGAGRGSCTIRR